MSIPKRGPAANDAHGVRNFPVCLAWWDQREKKKPGPGESMHRLSQVLRIRRRPMCQRETTPRPSLCLPCLARSADKPESPGNIKLSFRLACLLRWGKVSWLMFLSPVNHYGLCHELDQLKNTGKQGTHAGKSPYLAKSAKILNLLCSLCWSAYNLDSTGTVVSLSACNLDMVVLQIWTGNDMFEATFNWTWNIMLNMVTSSCSTPSESLSSWRVIS